MDLREQTRQLEAEHAAQPEQLEEDTFDLRFKQLMLSGDLQLMKRGEGEFRMRRATECVMQRMN